MVTSFARLCYLVKKLIVGRTGDARCDLLDFYKKYFNDCCTMIACVIGVFTMTFDEWCGVLMSFACGLEKNLLLLLRENEKK